MKIKILLALVSFSLLTPVYVLAADYKLAPEFNTLCWKLDDCNLNRAYFLNKTPEELKGNKDGWLQGEDPCTGSEWGKCLPAGQTKTTIAFAGKKSFTDIGDFLKYNYNIGLGIAGILAVIMIVVAGIQWVTSGGNSEMISSAKKRIGGALIGLLIAYLSYTILNIVNPALVNLRLPQVYMIRPIKTVPRFCKDIESASTTKFAFAGEPGAVVSKDTFPKAKMEDMKMEQMECGKQYFPDGGAGITCMGNACSASPNKTCFPVTVQDTKVSLQPSCSNHEIVVRLTVDPSIETILKNQTALTAEIAQDWLDDSLDVWGVCSTENGHLYIGDNKEGWNGNSQSFPGSVKSPFKDYYMVVDHLNPDVEGNNKEPFWDCNSSIVKGKLVGFVFKYELVLRSLLGGEAFYQANFYVSDQFVGHWQSISKNGYISLEDIKKGVYLEKSLSSQEVVYLKDNKSTEPSMMSKDGEASQGPIKLFMGLEKK